MSEVPLGAFLSGGVDSSGVVAMMAGLSADPVNTCSISFGDPAFNESAYAQTVAQRYHTRHRVEQVDPDDFGLVDKLATLYDEPYADSSAMPTYRVCELARKTVTVALSGDGGDESFGGYRRYRWHVNEERLRSLLPLQLRKPVFGLLGKLYPKADWAPRVFRAKSTFEALARNSVEAYFHSVSILHDGMREQTVQRALPQRTARLCRRRGAQAARRARALGSSAVAHSVPRSQDLSGGRHQHQGGPGQHGARAGSARAADGSSAGGMAVEPSSRLQAAQRGGQVPPEEGARAVSARRRSFIAPRWVLRFRLPNGSAGRCGSR